MARATRIKSHEDLEAYQLVFLLAMRVFELPKAFPREETYSLTDQIRRASRSVCANIAEGWQKRLYSAAFVSKLSDAETGATETQVWAQFAVACKYLPIDAGDEIRRGYDHVIGKLVKMMTHPEEWALPSGEH